MFSVDNSLTALTRCQIISSSLTTLTPSDVSDTAVVEKEGTQLGVIAQEIEKFLPEVVKTESTGVKSVDPDNLTWYMINAIKELKKENDDLKTLIKNSSSFAAPKSSL